MGQRLHDELRTKDVDPLEIDRQVRKSLSRINSAPNGLVCSIVRDGLRMSGDVLADDLEFQMAVQSVGALLQTLFLAAWERGIGTCWMAAPLYCQDTVRSTLQLSENYFPQALVLLGYPSGPSRVRPRRRLEEIVATE